MSGEMQKDYEPLSFEEYMDDIRRRAGVSPWHDYIPYLIGVLFLVLVALVMGWI